MADLATEHDLATVPNGVPLSTNGVSRASPIRSTIPRVGFANPASIRAMQDRDTPQASASASWVMSRPIRVDRHQRAKERRTGSVMHPGQPADTHLVRIHGCTAAHPASARRTLVALRDPGHVRLGRPHVALALLRLAGWQVDLRGRDVFVRHE